MSLPQCLWHNRTIFYFFRLHISVPQRNDQYSLILINAPETDDCLKNLSRARLKNIKTLYRKFLVLSWIKLEFVEGKITKRSISLWTSWPWLSNYYYFSSPFLREVSPCGWTDWAVWASTRCLDNLQLFIQPLKHLHESFFSFVMLSSTVLIICHSKSGFDPSFFEQITILGAAWSSG